jgi:thiosulfate/3-mercaptopyruvate sulfurtransferase
VDPDSFKFYVENGLSKFNTLPTWKLATPHNIRRQTPQNKACNSCHGNAALFLGEMDVKPEYLEANKKVIVPPELIPKKLKELSKVSHNTVIHTNGS